MNELKLPLTGLPIRHLADRQQLRKWSLSDEGLGFPTLCILSYRGGMVREAGRRSGEWWQGSQAGRQLRSCWQPYCEAETTGLRGGSPVDWVQLEGHRCRHSLVLGAGLLWQRGHHWFVTPPSQVVFPLNACTLACEKGKANIFKNPILIKIGEDFKGTSFLHDLVI